MYYNGNYIFIIHVKLSLLCRNSQSSQMSQLLSYLLSLSFNPLSHTSSLMQELGLCKPHFCFSSCCLVGSAVRGCQTKHPRLEKEERTQFLVYFLFLILLPVPGQCYSSNISSSWKRQFIQVAVTDSIDSLQHFQNSESASSCLFRDISISWAGPPSQRADCQLHWASFPRKGYGEPFPAVINSMVSQCSPYASSVFNTCVRVVCLGILRSMHIKQYT